MCPPLVSVIIPCFDAEPTIGDAVESALAQTYAPVEVVVVDDGSSDGSLARIQSFGARVRWRSVPNGGACAARNLGLSLARGALIQFLDADDLLCPDKLQHQVPMTLAHPADLVHTDGVLESPDGTEQAYAAPVEAQDPVVFSLLRWVPTLAPLHWRATLLEAGGWREDLPCSQERELHLRLSCRLRGAHRRLPRPLFRVRRRPGSLSSGDDYYRRVLDQRAAYVRTCARGLARRGQLSAERRRALAFRLADDGRTYLMLGRVGQALRNVRTSIRLAPDVWLETVQGPWGVQQLSRRLGPGAVRLVQLYQRWFKRHCRPLGRVDAAAAGR